MKALEDMKTWLGQGDELGRVAVYDATNTTKQRRAWLVDQLSDEIPISKVVIG